MSKKYLIMLLTTLLIFSGCGKNTANPVNDNTSETTEKSDNLNDGGDEETAKEEVEESIADEEPTELVTDYYTNEGSYEIKYDESESYPFNFSYRIPMITDGSKDAEKFNKKIQEQFKSVTDLVDAIVAGESDEVYEADYMAISYETFENGDILSIVVTAEGTYSDWVDYGVFNYDKANKKAVSNDEILKTAGMTEDEFYKYAKTAFGLKASSFIVESFEGAEERNDGSEMWIAGIIPGMLNDYVRTVDSVNLESGTQIFLGKDGVLNAIGLVHVQAGAGQYYNIVEVKPCEDVNFTDIYKPYVEKAKMDAFEKRCFELYNLEGYSATVTHEVESGNTYQSDIYIGFDDTDENIFLFQDYCADAGISLAYSGTIKWISVDENGLEYEYVLDHLDGEWMHEKPFTGRFYLKCYSEFDEKALDYNIGARYKFIEGDDLFDSKGEVVELEKTYG